MSIRGTSGGFVLHIILETKLTGQPPSQTFLVAVPQGTWAQEGLSMTIKCPAPEMEQVTLARSFLAKTSHKAPSISNNTMFLEEKEQEIFGKTCHGVSQSKYENKLRESAYHSAWHIGGIPQTVIGSLESWGKAEMKFISCPIHSSVTNRPSFNWRNGPWLNSLNSYYTSDNRQLLPSRAHRGKGHKHM